MVKKARLIYNPSSGREEVKRRLPEILQCLEQGGLETSTHATVDQDDVFFAAREAARRKFDVIVAAGGDGTLQGVVNGIAEESYRPKLGILPFGTTNDFARALHIPRPLHAACELITNGYSVPVDIGKINKEYFINITAGGSLTELTYEVPSKWKTMIGQLAYYMKGLEKLPRLRPMELILRSQEVMLHDQVMLFLVANSNSVGGLERLAPDASVNDGYFDVFVLKKCNLGEFIRIVNLALRGEHVDDPHLMYFRSRHLEISSPDRVLLNLDGELGGELPCTLTNVPSHIECMVNPTHFAVNGME